MDLNILRLTYFLILKRRPLVLFSLKQRSLTWLSQLRFESIWTPRYFTLSLVHSLLAYNLTFKLPSNFFCLNLKITTSSFLTLSEILFAFSQLTSCFKSALTSLFSFLIQLLRIIELLRYIGTYVFVLNRRSYWNGCQIFAQQKICIY